MLNLIIAGTVLAGFMSGCTHQLSGQDQGKVDETGAWSIQELALGGAFTPAVAVDARTQALYVAYAMPHQGGGYDLFIRRGQSGHVGMSEPVRINTEASVAHPIQSAPIRIAVAPDGELYVVWRQENMSSEVLKDYPWGLTKLLVTRSLDQGQTFADPIEVAADFPHAKDFPSLMVDASGRISIAWLTYGPGIDESDVNLSQSSDHGRSFSPPTVVDRVVCGCCGPAVASGPEGLTIVAWRDIERSMGGAADAEIRDIKFRTTLDNGVHFTEPQAVPISGWRESTCTHTASSVAVDRNHRAHIAYYSGRPDAQGTHYAAFDVKDGRYSAQVPLTVGDFVPPSKVSLALVDQKRVWLAWEDRVDQSHAGLKDQGGIDASSALIRYASIDERSGMIQRIGTLGPGVMPQVAAGPAGVNIVWSHQGTIFLARR
ncbi:MAG: hypothetical protein AB7P24_01240 [Nitrospira sp.]